MDNPTKGAIWGTYIRCKWLEARSEKKFWYTISGMLTFLYLMANRAAANTFVIAARLLMTATYLYRTLSYEA